MDTTTDECGPEDTHQLYDDHVVGKDVRVARGRVGAPSFETQVEDKDVERKEEEDAGDGEDSDVYNANFRFEAVLQETVHVAGTGGRSR